MTARTTVALAVMEDDTVLCAECVHEYQTEGLPETAATIVHAWLASPSGEVCGGCGVSDEEGVRMPESGSVWFRKAPGNTVSGPAHVVVQADEDCIGLRDTVGRAARLDAATFEREFVQVPELVEDDLRAAQREANDLEHRAALIREALRHVATAGTAPDRSRS
jgi:hypothetical protein